MKNPDHQVMFFGLAAGDKAGFQRLIDSLGSKNYTENRDQYGIIYHEDVNIPKIYISDFQAKKFGFNSADALAKWLGFDNVEALNKALTEAAKDKNGTGIDQRKARNIILNFAQIAENPELRSWLKLTANAAAQGGKQSFTKMLESFAKDDYKNTGDLVKCIIRSNNETEWETLLLATLNSINNKDDRSLVLLSALKDIMESVTANSADNSDLNVGKALAALLEQLRTGELSEDELAEIFTEIRNAKLEGRSIKPDILTKIEKAGASAKLNQYSGAVAQKSADDLKKSGEIKNNQASTPEEIAEAKRQEENARKAGEMLRQTAQTARDLGYMDIADGFDKSFKILDTAIKSYENNLSQSASAPQTSGDAALPATSSAGGGASTLSVGDAYSLTARIDALLKAATAEELKTELANVRAELSKLDERIEENNKNANKLFALELNAAAQKKLENELTEQKAAVQVLLELVGLAEKLSSAENTENTNTYRQTLEALAELAQWIAPRLENETAQTAQLLQQSFAKAQEAEKAKGNLRDFYKEQISTQIDRSFKNNYQAGLELEQTEAQSRLFDIFVDLAFEPVVSAGFLPDLQAVNTFIQKARTLAETIRLDKTFQKITDENTRVAVEKFCLQLEKISALPGLQIVMGWKTKLEIEQLERENQEINTPRTINACKSANEKLDSCNLPGMLTVWENLDAGEKQYQKTLIKEKLNELSVNELAEILRFNSYALPPDLREVVNMALADKLENMLKNMLSGKLKPEDKAALDDIAADPTMPADIRAMADELLDRLEEKEEKLKPVTA
jgi:uncharacterized protein (UPF0147 family)